MIYTYALAMDKKKALITFSWMVGIVLAGYGGYLVYDYFRVQKLNAAIVTPSEALGIIQQGLNS
jgi:hypothetical protein